MIFLHRNRAGSEKHLEWKVRLFLLGAALAMVGIAIESSLLTALAIVVLVAGVALRFWEKRESGDEGGDDAESDTGDPVR